MSGPSRRSLAQQLKQLNSESQTKTVDPDSAYTSLDANTAGIVREGDEGREHYLDVGRSRLRSKSGGLEQTLLSDKYAGRRRGRVKIFDDDEDSEPEDENVNGEHGGPNGLIALGEELVDDESERNEPEGEGGSQDDDEGGDEVEDEDEDEDSDDNGDEDEEDIQDENNPAQPPPLSSSKNGNSTRATLDPLASLRESRLKDIEKGRGIKRQRDLFDTLVTLRITFQKALVASSKLPSPLPTDPAGEIEEKKRDALRSLGELNEKLFALRENMLLPGVERPVELGKRKRGDSEAMTEDYWMDSARESLAVVDASHPSLLSILNKWSSKIQAASLQINSKQGGGSKFIQTTRNGAVGIVEAIEAGLASKRDTEKTLMESEESGYRSLLREVIESRGSGPGIDLTHLRREKKKKREAERGGSKGRKLRYTVHEKAQNFAVPIPLNHAWHDEQIDELFSSLFGGVGMKGATSDVVPVVVASREDGLAKLEGVRVF